VLHHPLVDFEMTVIKSVHRDRELDWDALDIKTKCAWNIETIRVEKRSDRHQMDSNKSLIESIPKTVN